ncbi:MAG: UDP-N-acetylglucosamine 1-carboxyvinyltransferase [Phycisphaerales bacterium]|nr:UDP-N-acetylglucosamine 1-carboxyvinyltransferase [Phycisphaerales bacterium]
MASFEVIGGKKLQGTIKPQGAKNECLQIICATLLTTEPVIIENIPDIEDVNVLINILENMGVAVNRVDRHTCHFQAKELNSEYLLSPSYIKKNGTLRGSIMLAGPLLTRCTKVLLPKPGGDKIGRRKLDTHITAFSKLGVHIEYQEDKDTFALLNTHNQLIGNYILLEEPSVTGTANILMASVLAKGKTTIYNAACEPYLQQLCSMLNSMGAKITGIGSNLLEIDGVRQLGGTKHILLPDMIEIGSFIGLAALTNSDIVIENAGIHYLGMIPHKFAMLGIHIEITGDNIRIPPQHVYEIVKNYDKIVPTIYDHPWPGLSPDLISILLVTAIQAKGSILIHQKMFESRLFFVDKLIDMGAQIILCDPHRAVVIGLERKFPLKGIVMSSPDIRAGQALLVAALSANGTSIVQNIEQIDRGYQYIDLRLQQLGAHIKRID